MVRKFLLSTLLYGILTFCFLFSTFTSAHAASAAHCMRCGSFNIVVDTLDEAGDDICGDCRYFNTVCYSSGRNTTYTNENREQHSRRVKCTSCNIILESVAESHAWNTYNYDNPNLRYRVCVCTHKLPDPITPVPLSYYAEGDIVYLRESGTPTPFYVAKHNYEEALNGLGRTLLVRADCYDLRRWSDTRLNTYATSEIDSWLNTTYISLLDPTIAEAAKTTVIYSAPGNGNNSAAPLSRAVFLMSMDEVHGPGQYVAVEGSRLPTYTLLRQGRFEGAYVHQWVRSPAEGGAVAYLWANGGNFQNNIYPDTSTAYSRPCLTLPADFKINTDGTVAAPAVTITWHANGGTVAGSNSTTSSVASGSIPAIPATPVRVGYTFAGWSPAVGVVTSNTTYTAQWTINSSTLTINPNGGTWNGSTSSTTKTQNYNTTLSVPNPSTTNYTATFSDGVTSKTTTRSFASWSVSGNAGSLSGTTFTFGSTANGTGTLTANWNSSYVITLPAGPNKTGHTFTGWSDGSTVKAAGTSVTLSKNTSYTAQFTANTYTISFDTQGGSAVSDFSRTYGSTLGTLPTPTKTNSVFNGWYTQPTSGTKVTSSTAVPAANTTYYAQWTQKFSVTVPTSIPVVVSSDGTATTVPVTISNASTGTVKITSFTINTLNGWTLVPESTAFSRVPVNSKQVCFKLNNAENAVIAKDSSLVLDAMVALSATSTPYSDEPILEVIFVMEWDAT